jgi:hypothetical protein
VAARLAYRVSTKKSIVLILALDASSELAALSVNTKALISSRRALPGKRENILKRVPPGEPIVPVFDRAAVW